MDQKPDHEVPLPVFPALMGVVRMNLSMTRPFFKRLVAGEMTHVAKAGVEGSITLVFEDGSELPLKLGDEDLRLFTAIAMQQPSMQALR